MKVVPCSLRIPYVPNGKFRAVRAVWPLSATAAGEIGAPKKNSAQAGGAPTE